MKIIGLIPARGGSKGIPGKNIKPLNGKPLILYTIATAREHPSVNRLIVSTDDQGIAEVARQYGAEVPFMRPKELSGDKVTDLPVIKHLVEWLKKNENTKADMILYLRPTTPFKTIDTISRCISLLQNNAEMTCVRTVNRSEGSNHPYWMFKNENGLLQPFIKNITIKDFPRRQLLPECYQINGVVDVFLPHTIETYNDLYGPRTGFIETDDQESIDIDTQLDFEFCEFLMGRKEMNFNF